jgi:hypothetical protein
MANELVLGRQNVELDNQPTDVIPQQDRGDISLDEDRLSARILELFRDDIRHKEYLDWSSKREYDIKAYYQLKEEAWANWPWQGASAYRGALTPTLVDTAWATLNESVWPSDGRPLQVKGVGVEDIRTSKVLEQYMNSVIENETNLRDIEEQNIFRMLLHGTGVIKVRRTVDGMSVDTSAVDVENIYVPLDAKGFRVDQTDHVFQVIPLTWTELETRKALNVYKNLDAIKPGIGISNERTRERVSTLVDTASGTDLTQYRRKNSYYILECYLTYFEKDSKRPKELIVWFAPNGGKILRVRENKDLIRPFARHVIYDVPGRFYGLSLPEKCQPIQDKLNYADKQYTDAMDRANMPAMFVEDTTTFDGDIAQRVPGGIYQKGQGKIDFEPVYPVERGFDRERMNLWMEAERLTGIADVIQGASTKSGRTLGETEIRTQAAGVRFNALFSRYEKGWKETMNILYEYQNRYVPREKKIKILGYTELTTIDEIFPQTETGYGLGLKSSMDFCFSGRPVIEREQEKEDFIRFYQEAMLNPIVQSNPANFWRLLDERAKVAGIRNLDSMISKPKEVDILSAQEYIQRVMSGQYNLPIRPGIDAENYMFEIQLFIQNESFQTLDQRAQMALMKALQQAQAIRQMEIQAEMDYMTVKNNLLQPPIEGEVVEQTQGV